MNFQLVLCVFPHIYSLSALEYEQLADETLDSLTEVFEDLPERLTCDPEYDVTLGVSSLNSMNLLITRFFITWFWL